MLVILPLAFNLWDNSRITYFLTLLGIPGLLFAQNSVLEPAGDTSAREPRVMLIPFDPIMYFSDSDKELAEYNQRTEEEIRTLFRHGLTFDIQASVMTRYDTHSLYSDTAQDAQEDLKAIYRALTYSYRTPASVPHVHQEKKGKKENLLFVLKRENKQTATSAQQSSQYIHPTAETRYMHASVLSPELFYYLGEKYDTELFLFINQFELKTNYEQCLDYSVNNFTREIYVHFCIYDADGKHLYGDVVKVFFPKNTNDIRVIMRENFPVIASYLAGKLPDQQNDNRTEIR